MFPIGERFVVFNPNCKVRISRDLFTCAGCSTDVDRFAAGFADERGWSHQWQPRIVDSEGREFCSEMCAHGHAQDQGWMQAVRRQ